MNVLLDTNIIIDLLGNRQPWIREAKAILELAADQKIDCYITAKEMTDLYYVLHRETHSNQRTRQILSHLCELVFVADTLSSDAVEALGSPISDYEDAVMDITATRTGMSPEISKISRKRKCLSFHLPDFLNHTMLRNSHLRG